VCTSLTTAVFNLFVLMKHRQARGMGTATAAQLLKIAESVYATEAQPSPNRDNIHQVKLSQVKSSQVKESTSKLG
jgi:predicted acetyltransferase